MFMVSYAKPGSAFVKASTGSVAVVAKTVDSAISKVRAAKPTVEVRSAVRKGVALKVARVAGATYPSVSGKVTRIAKLKDRNLRAIVKAFEQGNGPKLRTLGIFKALKNEAARRGLRTA